MESLIILLVTSLMRLFAFPFRDSDFHPPERLLELVKIIEICDLISGRNSRATNQLMIIELHGSGGNNRGPAKHERGKCVMCYYLD